MTKQEEKEVIRVCGSNYEPLDVPAYIRQRDKNEARDVEILLEDDRNAKVAEEMRL